jgi:hypothetical protein
MEAKVAYLQTIQGVINRLAANSFLLKGWSVTIVVALFSLAAIETNQRFIWIAYFPMVIFWFLDAYYLSQERKYKDLYDEVRVVEPSPTIDFSLHADKFKSKRNSFLSALFSKTVVFFHGAIFAALLLVTFVIW